MPNRPMRAARAPFAHPSRRTVLASALGLGALALTGCGGGTEEDEANVRFANATVDYATADFWADSSKVVSALANGGNASGWVTLDADDHQVALHATGSSSAKLTETRNFAKDSYTTVLAYGSLATSIKFRYLAESNAAPDSGVKLRVLHVSPSLGALDIYVTNASSLSGLAPTVTVSAFDSLTDFVAVSADSYRVRITAAGDQGNVLYDLPSKVSMDSKLVITLVVAPRTTGSLPNVLALPEQNGAVLLPNSLAS